MARRRILDSEGVEVTAGCVIGFAYGIPPVGVRATVIDRNGTLIALTPGHNPSECKVRDLRRHVGDFWVRKTAGHALQGPGQGQGLPLQEPRRHEHGPEDGAGQGEDFQGPAQEVEGVPGE